MSRRSAVAVCVLALAGAGVLLGACNPDEGDRVLRYEPGVYKGKPDTPLAEDQLRALRARAAYQAGVSVAAGTPGGGGAREADVRVPGDALRARGSLQAGAGVSRGGGATPAVGGVPAGALRGRTTLQGGGSVRPPGQ
ncbi:MAG: hypothetical protein H6907_08775 [Hyphomicrobiales bacterium]|nr:hypothetical protein [Hyphomicrobiales bacterium]MCP5371811.1 hypothetical protein [Hyphomicrobiales bacterium]